MNKRGIIDVITLVLLVVIAIAAVAAVWMWMSGFLPGILPSTRVAPEPISIASYTCDATPPAGSEEITVSVRNVGSRAIPAGTWSVSISRLNPTTGNWEGPICTYNYAAANPLNPGAVEGPIQVSCSISAGDELSITVSSPQGSTISASCRAAA